MISVLRQEQARHRVEAASVWDEHMARSSKSGCIVMTIFRGRAMQSALGMADYSAIAAIVVSLLILGASAFGGSSAILDLASLVVAPATVAIAASALWLMIRAKSTARRLIAVFCAIPAIPLLASTPAPAVVCRSGKADLKVAWLNAHNPQDSQKIARWLEREDPQIVGLAEVSPRSKAVRRFLETKYANWYSCLDNGRCSTVLYSSLQPMQVQALARGDPENRRALSAVRMTFPGREGGVPFRVVAAHLSRALPLGRQAGEISQIEAALGSSSNTIVMGDFNMSPRMKILRNFAARNGLSVSRTPGPTWPTTVGDWPIPGLWQIDQLLVGGEWKVARIRLAPDVGSDHRGYVAYLCQVPPI